MGTPASANSSVEVPDLTRAARAVRNAACFSSASTTTRAEIRQVATAARTSLTSHGTAGTATSSAPTCAAVSATASPKTFAIRRVSAPPARLLCIGPQIVELFDQRMADIGAGRPAQFAHHLRLERQQRQYMVNVAFHRACAAGTPSPYPKGRRNR